MDTCAICLEEINEIEKCTNDCNHSFCKPCVDGWLDKGNNTCPLCRVSIKYFENRGEKYRLVIKKTNPSPRRRNQRPRGSTIIIGANAIPINRAMFNTLKFAFYSTLLFSIIQGYFIHNLKDDNHTLNNRLHACQINASYLNDIIDENNYFSDDHYDNYLILDKAQDILRVCYLPVDFMARCFT